MLFDAHCVGNCNDTYDRLYPVNVGGVGNDYPRSTVLYSVHPASQYIALGDSYSSGEGNPPFLPGTDIDTAGSGSPFASHLLCMGDPWFQNVDQAFNNAAYVFHPNQAGQEGLATIVGATINAG